VKPTLRALAACLLVTALLAVLSPVYRDLITDARGRYRGTSPADFMGPMEYDRRVLRDFSWGAWFWNPDKAFGIPRVQDLGNRPMYPVNWALVTAMPTEQAWRWYFLLHTALKLVGLVLLCEALGWPFWIVVVASAGSMLAEGSLVQFGDITYLSSGAWLPVLLWLTLEASRRPRLSGWDAAWSVAAACWALCFHPQLGVYYAVLLLVFTLWVEWNALRSRLPALIVRHLAAALLVAPYLLPAAAHYAESGRRSMMAFEDWHLRRAYTWWKYRMSWSTFWQSSFYPWGAWVAIALGAFVGGLRGTLLWPVFAVYLVFGLLHAVPWLAVPMWATGVALFPFRLPERVFEPFMWLGILLLAELAAREQLNGRRQALGTLLVVAFLSCAWQTSHDPRRAYLNPRWERELPTELAARVRAEPRAPAVFVTGTDRAPDQRAPLLNSQHNLLLGIPAAHFFGEVPNQYFTRATYRVPGLLFMQRMATPLADWDDVVDVYAELGVGWVFWDGGGDPAHPRLTRVGEENGFRLYRIAGARPIVYAVDAIRRVREPKNPAGVTPLVFSLPALGPFCYGCPAEAAASPAGEVKLGTQWHPGDVSVSVDSPRGTFVVLGETRSRGWRATVDDRTAPIYPVDELFQGVAVPPGAHVIRWRFVSPGFFLGLWLAAAGALLLLGALVMSWRRARS
jgi:Bacterial membrane protein YfhO